MEKNKIKILLNGKKYLIGKDKNIDDLVKDLNLKNKSFALAINGEVVKKEAFKRFIIKVDSKIEIISAVGGG
jgi:sulfur carrier protein